MVSKTHEPENDPNFSFFEDFLKYFVSNFIVYIVIFSR